MPVRLSSHSIQSETGRWSCRDARSSVCGIISKTSADQFLLSNQLTEILKTDPENAVFDLALELIHSAERRPGDTHACTREGAAMAGTDEFVLLVYPAHSAAQMWTYRGQHFQAATSGRHDVDAVLHHAAAPAFDPLDVDHPRNGLLERVEFVDLPDVGPGRRFR